MNDYDIWITTQRLMKMAEGNESNVDNSSKTWLKFLSISVYDLKTAWIIWTGISSLTGSLECGKYI